jgi:hypothetical protein
MITTALEARDLRSASVSRPSSNSWSRRWSARGCAFDLVEQHDAERLRSHSRREQAVGIPAIADQTRHRVGSRHLAHVDPDQARLIAVEVLRDRGRELGLAGAGRAGEQQHRHRA